MRLKVRGGTVQHDEPSLCVSCRHSTIIRGQGFRDEIVECGRLSWENNRIDFRVTSCSDYSDRSLPELRKMEEIAWVLRVDKLRAPIGFVRAKDVDKDERHKLSDGGEFD
jgi:hypothetical protein